MDRAELPPLPAIGQSPRAGLSKASGRRPHLELVMCPRRHTACISLASQASVRLSWLCAPPHAPG